ncbi:13974_t:CDS:2, partial [Funneliformis mosseae]
MAQQPNLPTNIPREVVPTQPSNPPTHQELGQLDRLMYKLVIANGRSHSARHSPSSYLIEKCALTVYLGTVTDTELGAWREYSHSLVTTRGIADQAITNAINNACAPNGAIDQAITNGINNAYAPNGAIYQAIANACAPNGTIYSLFDVSCQTSMARTNNGNASRDADEFREFPNMDGVLPSA